MRTLEIHIPDDVAARIEAAAQTRGVSVEELVQLSLEEKLARDAEFDRAAKQVLAKSAELYEPVGVTITGDDPSSHEIRSLAYRAKRHGTPTGDGPGPK